MKIGSLFSGIGGLELGLELAGVGHTAWQVEQDEFCRAVLKKHWPAAAQYQDVREVGASNLERVEVVCGGFPCQDISQAGKGAGLGGARSGLYFEYLRVIQEISPRFVVIENVAALLRRGLDVVLSTLDESGYDASWSTIRASDVGARHRRDRLFVVAWKRTVVDDSRFGSGERAAENLGEASGSGWTQAGGAPPLSVQVVRQWPTPRHEGFDAGAHRGKPDSLHSAVRFWPTLTVNNAEDKGTSPSEFLRHTPELSAAVQPSAPLTRPSTRGSTSEPAKRLNPGWVSQLMGFAADWTLLDPEVSRSLGKSRASSRSRKTGPND